MINIKSVAEQALDEVSEQCAFDDAELFVSALCKQSNIAPSSLVKPINYVLIDGDLLRCFRLCNDNKFKTTTIDRDGNLVIELDDEHSDPVSMPLLLWDAVGYTLSFNFPAAQGTPS